MTKTLSLLTAAATIAVTLSTTVAARSRHDDSGYRDYWRAQEVRYQEPIYKVTGTVRIKITKRKHHHRVANHGRHRVAAKRNQHRHATKRVYRGPAVRDLVPPLAAKVREIVGACGSKLVSGYRPGARVRGSGRLSLHASYPARAADLAGNPACIRRHLAGWPGGLSTDYSRVRHYHVSYEPRGREWGRRFAHSGYRIRYARAR